VYHKLRLFNNPLYVMPTKRWSSSIFSMRNWNRWVIMLWKSRELTASCFNITPTCDRMDNKNAKAVGAQCSSTVLHHAMTVNYLTFLHSNSTTQSGGSLICIQYMLARWCGGATGKALDLQSTGCGFNSYTLGKSCVTTLGKLALGLTAADIRLLSLLQSHLQQYTL